MAPRFYIVETRKLALVYQNICSVSSDFAISEHTLLPAHNARSPAPLAIFTNVLCLLGMGQNLRFQLYNLGRFGGHRVPTPRGYPAIQEGSFSGSGRAAALPEPEREVRRALRRPRAHRTVK